MRTRKITCAVCAALAGLLRFFPLDLLTSIREYLDMSSLTGRTFSECVALAVRFTPAWELALAALGLLALIAALVCLVAGSFERALRFRLFLLFYSGAALVTYAVLDVLILFVIDEALILSGLLTLFYAFVFTVTLIVHRQEAGRI